MVLGVSPERVRQLVVAGDLPGGEVWECVGGLS